MKRPQSAALRRPLVNDQMVILKTTINELADENRKLKTQNTALKRELQKYEHVDENLISQSRLLGRSTEGSLVPTLKYRIRMMTQEIESLKAQQILMNRQIRTTNIQEMQLQLQDYQEEIQRLTGMLNESLRVPLEQQKGNKYLQYLQRIEQLKHEVNMYQELNSKSEKETRQLTAQLKKAQENLQTAIREKHILNAKLSDFESFQQPVQTPLDEAGELKVRLTEKERQLTDSQEQFKSLQKQTTQKMSQQLQYIEQQAALINVKDTMIQNLNQDLMSLKERFKQAQEEQIRQQSRTIKKDAFTNISLEDHTLESLKIQFKFRMKRRWIPISRLSEFIAQKDIKFGPLRELLQYFPFEFNLSQAHQIATYLLTPEHSDLLKTHTIEDLPLEVLVSRLQHFTKYEITTPVQDADVFMSIAKRIQQYENSLRDIIKQIKKSNKSQCTVSQFQEATRVIFENAFTNREMEVIHQISYELSGLTEVLDLDRVFAAFNIKQLKVADNLSVRPPWILFQYYREAIIKPIRSRMSIASNQPSIVDLQSSRNRKMICVNFTIFSKKKTIKSLSKYNFQLNVNHHIQKSHTQSQTKAKELSVSRIPTIVIKTLDEHIKCMVEHYLNSFIQ